MALQRSLKHLLEICEIRSTSPVGFTQNNWTKEGALGSVGRIIDKQSYNNKK